MALANLSLNLLCLLSPAPLLAGRAEGWQKMGPWVHSLTEAGYASRDPRAKEISGSGDVKPIHNGWTEEGDSGLQAKWLAQAGYSVSDGVQVAERRSTAPGEQFQPSRIHSLTESGFAGGGLGEAGRVEGRSRGVELLPMESIFRPSRPDNHHNDERARESSRIEQSAFLATRYYPRQDSAQPKAGHWKQESEKKIGPLKYLLADPANHTYLKLPMKDLLRRLQTNKQLLREKIMHRQEAT